MPDDDETPKMLQELVRKRGNIKGRLTVFKNYVVSLSKPLDRSQVNGLQLRVSQMMKVFEQYDELQSQIEFQSDDQDAQSKEREEFESSYYDSLGKAQEIIEFYSRPVPSESDKGSSSHDNYHTHNPVKLPTISLPKFSGSYDHWLEFYDSFLTLIHNENKIPDITKFHYLRSSLEGSAKLVINSIEFSAANYQVAWELLCDRFDNKRLLIQNHVAAIFNMSSVTRETSASIRRLIDDLNKNLRALETLKEPTDRWDTLLIYILTSKLDSKSYREWEELKSRLDKTKSITLDVLVSFLHSRADLLETLEMTQSNANQSQRSHNSNKIKTMLTVTNAQSSHSTQVKNVLCPKCSSEHRLSDCPQFLSLTNEQRLQMLPEIKVCFNCFKKGHYANQCKKSGCKICKKRHNILIHVSSETRRQSTPSEGMVSPNNSSASSESPSTSENPNVTLAVNVSTGGRGGREVLLSTALVKLLDVTGHEHFARAVLDSGSTSCIITENLFKKLNLPVRQVNQSVIGVNNSLSHVAKMCECKLFSIDKSYKTNINCFILPSITEQIPSRHIDILEFDIPDGLSLSDPQFNTPSDVDMIIGADLFWELLGTQKIKLGSGKPFLYETKLGWIVSGPVYDRSFNNSSPIRCNFIQVTSNTNDEIDHRLSRFWELEEVDNKSPCYSQEEKLCEEHFVKNVSRLPDGRFCVRIPLKESAQVLGDSFDKAKKCFLSMERRLQHNSDLHRRYCEFMSEYESLGHMTVIVCESCEAAHFIPYHGVLRESSTTTKLRIVFNGSCPTCSGRSLNSIQMVGPTIQSDLLSILTRFRQHKYILAADVEKMYRQVVVHPDDRYLQQILWREDPTAPIKIYQLNTVTYGTASAPFLAIRCLKQLGLDCKDEKVAEVIINDFYVDDLLTGVDSIEAGQKLRHDITEVLASGCMPLRKWKSNEPSLLSSNKKEHSSHDLNIGASEPCKTLGLGWQPQSDELHFSNNIDVPEEFTKRAVLSVISKIFDPLGLLSPCVIVFKMMLQNLWLHKLSWDERVPSDISQQLADILKSLPLLNEIRIPRRVVCDTTKPIEIHIFSDASQKAYGACAYVLSIDEYGQVTVRLLIAKSRVARLTATTIPRLELCGALTSARLYVKIINALRLKIGRCVFWTDSTIVLGWLKMHPTKLQPFVRNRVSEIIETTGEWSWRHVPTDQNPADYISRGVNVSSMQSLKQWWEGPEFLKGSELGYPPNLGGSNNLPELRPEVTLLTTQSSSTNLIDFNRFSSLTRLTRAVAYVLRFINNCRSRSKNSSNLSAHELNQASIIIQKQVQTESFPEYKTLISNKDALPNKSPLLKLNPFLDSNGLLRVGGRLSNSGFDYNKKYPIIIHSNHVYTKLLFENQHKKLLHAGPQLLLASIREAFWPIGGRNLARACYRKCVKCSRIKGQTVNPIMGNLPQHRLQPGGYPFENTGIDYAGPLLALSRQGRGSKIVKVYIALFVCFTTKAIHIELVGDLTSNCFISALRRFMARRGKPVNIFSDNGTTFVGACNEISKFLKSHSKTLSENVSNEGINFHFTPPYAPHFGGLWEAGVKSTKYHLVRVLGNCHLTYEDLQTVLVQIEAVLNSRPLTPLSSNPDDLQPLTPGHFLIGRPMTTLPVSSYKDTNKNLLTRYQRIEQFRQNFWTRWSKEYVSELQHRTKWRVSNHPLSIDTMVVIKDDNTPPLKWKLGRIVDVVPGQDGVNRVADIRTSTGIIRRAFSKICPLPI